MAGNASGTQIRLGCQPPNIVNATPLNPLPPPTNAAIASPVPLAPKGVEQTILTPTIDETPPVQAPPEEATGGDTAAPPALPDAPQTINLDGDGGQRWSPCLQAYLCVPINGLVVWKVWLICHPTTGYQVSFRRIFGRRICPLTTSYSCFLQSSFRTRYNWRIYSCRKRADFTRRQVRS